MVSKYHWLSVADGREKTRLLEALVFQGATEPMVREVAQGLIRGTNRNDHWERLARLHRFVRDSVDYHREPVEQFQSPSLTLERGGDCDDLVLLLAALAWSLRYPWRIRAVGNPRDPHHYSLELGWPAADEPHGNERTRWIHAEPSVAATFGESAEQAAQRGAML